MLAAPCHPALKNHAPAAASPAACHAMVTIPNRAASTRAYAITAESARPAAAGAAAGQIPAASVPSRWTSAVNASVIRGADAGDIVLQYS
ncbi:hypothetical protein ACQCSU_13850 [Pseudarthrobacter sp. O4]|uniref:hypothetical protein n=1 Tax=Pseudarthrobacter sp. O4 TaxID=3418417 RepID=UPI003CF4C31C